ncbi:MAG: SpoIIE family protein phosphatase [Candidatus Puniceispirillaceae bacterium]
MAAPIKQETIPAFGGLFSRIVIAASVSAIIAVAVITSFFGLYLESQSAREAQRRLERSIAVLAPVVDGAMAQDDMATARQILVNLIEEEGVVCVDYRAPWAEEADIREILRLPEGGCANFNEHNTSFMEVAINSSSQGAYRFYIDKRYFSDNRNEQLFRMAVTSAITLIIVFMMLAVVFHWLVLRPLRNLQSAMVASQPSKPVLADIYRPDEIGAVSRTYNKLAAASRIYFARLEKSQKNLRSSETKFKDMAEISGDWFYEMDSEFRFTYISDRFFEITNILPDEVIGKTRTELVGEKANEANWQQHLQDLAQRQPFKNFEYPFHVLGKETVILRINGKPLWDEEGVFIGYRGTGTDVTDITRDRQLLEETNRNFGESVSYASDIQRGLLPDTDKLNEYFGKSVLLWQPKDLVGGDFYWIGQMGGARYMVFFDCTGHGVPGALMTLVTVSVIEKIVAASPFALPAPQMLEQIHQGVCAQLGITKDKSGKDGLDCAVIKLDNSEGQLEFAGASLDLMVVADDGTVTRLRGSRHTIGYRLYDEPRQFDSHNCQLSGHSFVLITDGLATQIGEQTKRVLGTRRIIEALQSAGDNSPAKLTRALGLCLKRWQGSEERRDDVTILAFRPYE